MIQGACCRACEDCGVSTAPNGRSRVRRGWGGLLALLLACLVSAAWAVASAPASSPDDDYHLASIWCAWASEDAGCTKVDAGVGAAYQTVSVPDLAIQSAQCAAFHPEVSGQCPYLRADGTAGTPDLDVYHMRADNGSYPAGYYSLMRLFVRESAATSIVVMRLVTAFICLALLVLSGVVSAKEDRWRLWLYYAVGAVPLGLFLFASTNPSGPAIAGATAVFPAVVAGLGAASAGRRYWPAAILAAVASLVAVQSRSDAVYFCGLALVAATIVALRWRGSRPAAQTMAIAPAAVVIMWAFVSRNAGGLVPTEGPGGVGAPTGANIVNLLGMYIGEFATRLGWLDTTMPTVVWAAIALALGALLGYGVGSLSGRRAAGWALVMAIVVALPLVMLEQWGASVGVGVQPRYMLPLVGILLALLALPGSDPGPRPNRRQLMWVAALASLAHALALHVLMRRYITGVDATGFNLNWGREWWWDVPVQPMTTWAVGALAFAGLVAQLAMRGGAPHVGADQRGERASQSEESGPGEEVDDDLAGVELVQDRRDAVARLGRRRTDPTSRDRSARARCSGRGPCASQCAPGGSALGSPGRRTPAAGPRCRSRRTQHLPLPWRTARAAASPGAAGGRRTRPSSPARVSASRSDAPA